MPVHTPSCANAQQKGTRARTAAVSTFTYMDVFSVFCAKSSQPMRHGMAWHGMPW